MTFSTDILLFIISGVGAIMWYLLKQKDEKQGREIEMLFKKHDEDVQALQELRVQIAEGHYKKTELDYKFDRIELAITNSFSNLASKFDKLSDVLIAHITHEDKGN
jgi:uncharacterized protein HemX